MKLILVRHGKALREGACDASRPLQKKTVQNIQKNLQTLANLTRAWNDPAQPVCLWTSPKKRTLQTARLIAKAVEPESIKEQKFLEEQDLESALMHLAQVPPNQVLILVGHEPFLHRLHEALTGKEFVYRTSTLSALYWPSRRRGEARLHWTLRLEQPSEGLWITEPGSGFLAQEALGAFAKGYWQIQGARTDFLEEPQQPETVHKLRVKIRRFRSLLSFFGPLLGKKKSRRLQEGWRRMGQSLGYLRELDVLLEEFQALEKRTGMEDSYKDLIGLLKQERLQEQEALFKKVADPSFEEQLKHLGSGVLQAAARGSLEEEALSCYILKRMEKWDQEIEKRARRISENRLEVIHPLRIRCKKYRYLYEMLGDHLPLQSKDRYRQAKALQTHLGQICDANRNTQALEEILSGQEPLSDSLAKEQALFEKAQSAQSKRHYQAFQEQFH